MTNEDAVRHWIGQGLNAGNADFVDGLYTPDVVWHGPSGQTIHGRDDLKEMVQGYLAAFPAMKMTIEHIFSAGDWVSVRWRLRGKHSGPMGDIPATGRDIDMPGLIQCRFENGQVAEEFELFDELLMLKQLGLMED
jgi:steroid delta-isomerase-like uncharacterized protein